MYSLDLEKAEESEIKLPTSAGTSKKQESSRKTSTSALLYAGQEAPVINGHGKKKFLKWWKYQTTLPVFYEICMHVKKQQLKLDMEQQTGSK